MSLKPLLLVAAGAAASIAVAPIAAADWNPPVADDGSASATIADLQAQGYSVQINWIRGTSRVPLSYCSVTGIHNPDSSAASRDTLTTVYVDVLCPDDEWGGGVGFGVGF
jgi:hypothetical protein